MGRHAATLLRQPGQIFEILLALCGSPVVTGLVLGAHQTVGTAASVVTGKPTAFFHC